MKRLLLLLTTLCFIVVANAQKMEFTFSGLSGVKSQMLYDGTMLVQFPAGTDLTEMSTYGMSVTADGVPANITDIVPNPSSKTDYVDGGLNVFYYKGKSYKVRFAAGEYFTAVFFSDALLGSASSLSKSELSEFADRVTKMGTSSGPTFTFSSLPGYIPTADIAFFLGDMNATTSQSPIIHTLDDSYMNIVNKCAIVAGQIESTGTSATITEYGLCYGTSANPTTSDTYKAASDLGGADDTFGTTFNNVFGVYFDNLTGQTTYHVRAYCKYTLSGSSTVYTTYGEDRTFTTPGVSGMTWAWEGGETPSDEVRARIEEAMNGAKEYYNHYCTLYKWAGTAYVSGVQTADCSLRSDGSCYIRFGPNERYQWVGTAQHELSHGYGVGQTGAYSGYSNPFNFKVATLTLRVFLQDMSMLISHDSMHYWPGGINQREEVTDGTSNSKGTYTCKNEEMLKCNAMILNGLAKDGMQTWYGWAKQRDRFDFQSDESRSDAGPRKVSQSSNSSASDFEDALDAFNQAGIPLILAPGDMDLASTASSDGYTLNSMTYSVVSRSIAEAQTHGVSDVFRFSGTSLSNTVQPQPYAFLFKGVRFYNGMKFWFDKPIYKYSNSSYRSLTPDLILSNLTTYVGNHSSETSIWVQHIPFDADDNTWLDNTGTVYRYSNGTNSYTGYNATYNAYNTAARRRTKLSALISQTSNASMFSGHGGTYNDNNYNSQFHDYTVANLNTTPCDAYIVLMKAGTGVVEVQPVSFRNYEPYTTQYDDPATEYPAGYENAILAGLVQGIDNLNIEDGTLSEALSAAKNVNSSSNVTTSISSLNTAFGAYMEDQADDVDVSGLLGQNLDFESPSGTSTNDNIHAVEGWNEVVNVSTTGWGVLSYKTGLGSPNGGNALQIRENWKGNPSLPSVIQVYKDAVLPEGVYLLQFEIRQDAANVTESLNYYELNGQRTYFSAGNSWETKTIQINVTEPSTLRLSFGFVGATREGNLPNEIDLDNITLTLTKEIIPEGKEGMNEEGWTQLTALPNDYSPYFFTIWDHTRDLALVPKPGNHQGSATNAVWYAENITPAFDKTALWTFDSNVENNVEYVVMTNAMFRDYMMQTEWNAAYYFHIHDNGGGGIDWGRTILAYSDGKWTIQNGKYPETGYLGPWDPGVFTETALNKQGSDIGYFDIYSILRGEYVALYETTKNASAENPVDITYCLENPGGERRSSIGWKTEGAGWWSQASTAMNGKVGEFFLESWNGSGMEASDLYQEISGLPDGFYRFSAIAHCTSDCYIYANDTQEAMPTDNSGTRVSVTVYVSDGSLRVGFKTGSNPGSWIAFDDAKLEYLGVVVLDEMASAPPASMDGVTVKLLRSIISKDNVESGNAWNTVCLPFTMNESQLKEQFGDDVVVKQLTSVTNSGKYAVLSFEPVNVIQANKPYIMQVSKGGKEYIIKNVDVAPSDNLTQTVGVLQFIGNYVYPFTMSNTGGTDYYILNDHFKSSTGRTKIKGFRAYFHVPESSGVKVLNFNLDDATGMAVIESDVRFPADIYNVSGQLVRRNVTSLERLPKGIYIVNGSKVMVK